MPTEYSARLDAAERTPDWDLKALRTHIVATSSSWSNSNSSRDDQRRFTQLCKKYRSQLQNLSPAE